MIKEIPPMRTHETKTDLVETIMTVQYAIGIMEQDKSI